MPLWDKLHCFMRAYESIKERALTEPRPFIYEVLGNSQLQQIQIPEDVTSLPAELPSAEPPSETPAQTP